MAAPSQAAAYFVCAEALANVVKHAHASHVRVSARIRGGAYVVEIRDDGVGGAKPSPAPACAGSSIASRRSAALCESRARPVAERSSPPSCRSTARTADPSDRSRYPPDVDSAMLRPPRRPRTVIGPAAFSKPNQRPAIVTDPPAALGALTDRRPVRIPWLHRP